MANTELWCVVTLSNATEKKIYELDRLFYRTPCNEVKKCTARWAKEQVTAPAIRKRHVRVLKNDSHDPIGHITGVFDSKEKALEDLNDKSQGRGKRVLRLSAKVADTPSHMPVSKKSDKKNVPIEKTSRTNQSVNKKKISNVKGRVNGNTKLKAAIEKSACNSTIDLRKFLNKQKVMQSSRVLSQAAPRMSERIESSVHLSQPLPSSDRSFNAKSSSFLRKDQFAENGEFGRIISLPEGDTMNPKKRRRSTAGLIDKEAKLKRPAVESRSSSQPSAVSVVRDNREKKNPRNTGCKSELIKAYAAEQSITPRTHWPKRSTEDSATMIRGNMRLEMASTASDSTGSMNDQDSDSHASASEILADVAVVPTDVGPKGPTIAVVSDRQTDVTLPSKQSFIDGTIRDATNTGETTPVVTPSRNDVDRHQPLDIPAENTNKSLPLGEDCENSNPFEITTLPLAADSSTRVKEKSLKIVDEQINTEVPGSKEKLATDASTQSHDEILMIISCDNVNSESASTTSTAADNAHQMEGARSQIIGNNLDSGITEQTEKSTDIGTTRSEDEASIVTTCDIFDDITEDSGSPTVNQSNRYGNETSKSSITYPEQPHNIQQLNAEASIPSENESDAKNLLSEKIPFENFSRGNTSDGSESKSSSSSSPIIRQTHGSDEVDSEQDDRSGGLPPHLAWNSINRMTRMEKIKYFSKTKSGSVNTSHEIKTLSEEEVREYRELLTSVDERTHEDEEDIASKVNILKEALRETLTSEQEWKRQCQTSKKKMHLKKIENLFDKKINQLSRKVTKNLGNKIRNLESRLTNCCERLALNIREDDTTDVSENELSEARRIPEMDFNEPMEKGSYCNIPVYTKPLNEALKAPDMRRRCAKVVEALWTPKQRRNLTWKATAQFPNRKVITKKDAEKIITICEKLQLVAGRKLPINDENDVRLQHRRWITILLKHERMKYKRQHGGSLNQSDADDQSSLEDDQSSLEDDQSSEDNDQNQSRYSSGSNDEND